MNGSRPSVTANGTPYRWPLRPVVADGSMPSLTCPNNMSIITGTPSSRHGIAGNVYLDAAAWQPVAMTGTELLSADSILTCFAEAGARVSSITAKDKLRKQLAKGLDCSQGHIDMAKAADMLLKSGQSFDLAINGTL